MLRATEKNRKKIDGNGGQENKFSTGFLLLLVVRHEFERQ